MEYDISTVNEMKRERECEKFVTVFLVFFIGLVLATWGDRLLNVRFPSGLTLCTKKEILLFSRNFSFVDSITIYSKYPIYEFRQGQLIPLGSHCFRRWRECHCWQPQHDRDFIFVRFFFEKRAHISTRQILNPVIRTSFLYFQFLAYLVCFLWSSSLSLSPRPLLRFLFGDSQLSHLSFHRCFMLFVVVIPFMIL